MMPVEAANSTPIKTIAIAKTPKPQNPKTPIGWNQLKNII